MVYFFDLKASEIEMTQFDKNRPFYFLQGFILVSFLGVFMSTQFELFVKSFLPMLFFMSMSICILYLLTYDPRVEFIRLGDGTSLSKGIALSYGCSSVLAIVFLRSVDKNIFSWGRPIFLMPALILMGLGIVLSGTRGAIVGFSISFIFFVFKQTKLAINTVIIFVLLVVLLVFVFRIDRLIPMETITRIGDFQHQGTERRVELNTLAIDNLINNPMGMTIGYEKVLDGNQYCHNTILQLVMESGILIVPVLFVVFITLLKSLIKQIWANNYLFAYFIIFSNVITQSYSSGSPYATFVWFSIFFLISISSTHGKSSSKILSNTHRVECIPTSLRLNKS